MVGNTFLSCSSKKNANNKQRLSAVLIIKLTAKNRENFQFEKNVKANCNILSLDVNVDSTKHIKDGLLVNCSDNKSLKQL